VTADLQQLFNQARVLEHELEGEAGGEISLQNILTVAREQR
jgi:hypothetical protein